MVRAPDEPAWPPGATREMRGERTELIPTPAKGLRNVLVVALTVPRLIPPHISALQLVLATYLPCSVSCLSLSAYHEGGLGCMVNALAVEDLLLRHVTWYRFAEKQQERRFQHVCDANASVSR